MIFNTTIIIAWLTFCAVAASVLSPLSFDWRLAVAIAAATATFFAVRNYLSPAAYLLTLLGGLVVMVPVVALIRNEPDVISWMIFITGCAGVANVILDDMIGIPRRFLLQSSPQH